MYMLKRLRKIRNVWRSPACLQPGLAKAVLQRGKPDIISLLVHWWHQVCPKPSIGLQLQEIFNIYFIVP